MSTPEENEPRNELRWIYITSILLIAVFVIGGLIVFSSAKSTSQANAKADQLIAALKQAGARAPDKDQIVRVLGSDGGATCDNPNKALSHATLLAQLSNGATGPGARPVVADSRVFKGQLLIIKIYCPDELKDFQSFVDDLKSANVVNE
jgi:Tfp pilus assembly protein FimT